jgi:hypothetical protein
MQKNLLDRDR